MKRVRCAIYTRKSSEEGLEQDFNSLDAQFEACSAYVLSQASEGWSALPARYDDGGISGGTLARPALQRLLADIGAGLIDIVVVYKVDRLTRSLLDFAKLVETFDKAGTSFVSITQSFNTTTSMGRLTLNMLLSFAQFEREVTAERIRDKIAASKAKGMWMGGTVPLGYEPNGRSLAIADEHAGLIRHVFARYLELGNVRLLAEEMKRGGMQCPKRISRQGRSYGCVWFSRGQLYLILRNPIYIGMIRHRENLYHGLHPAIIDQDTWDHTQAKLSDHVRGHRTGRASAHPSPLGGLVFDANGEPLVTAHANKGTARYRYYVSRALQHGGDAKASSGLRIPSQEIEALVFEKLSAILADPIGFLTDQKLSLPAADQMNEGVAAGKLASKDLLGGTDKLRTALLRDLISRVTVLPQRIDIALNSGALWKVWTISPSAGWGLKERIVISLNANLKRTGRALRMILDDETTATRNFPDNALVGAIAKAHRWWERLKAEPELTVKELATSEGVTKSYATRIIRLAFLDPDIVAMTIEGRSPAHMSTKRLTQPASIPMSWAAQRAQIGIAARA